MTYLHSTMFLLIHDWKLSCEKVKELLFTFHNVSINTGLYFTNAEDSGLFTFHNVSINTDCILQMLRILAYLHSTMFLLILILSSSSHSSSINLHSTMFLLIRIFRDLMTKTSSFTFHNVSINTKNSLYSSNIFSYLHSTMFLLIQSQSQTLYRLHSVFTFHNVSINTSFGVECTLLVSYLHSTMFLLIRVVAGFLSLQMLYLHSTMFLLILI